MSAKKCLDWLKEVVDSIPEIKKTGIMIDTADSFPYAVIRLDSQSYSQKSLAPHSTGLKGRFGTGEYIFLVEIHYPLENVLEDKTNVVCMVDSFMEAFRNKKLDNRVSATTSPVGTIRGLPSYGTILTYGPEFTITLRGEDWS